MALIQRVDHYRLHKIFYILINNH